VVWRWRPPAYLRGRGVEVRFAKTGVKYVHHEAVKYDLGIYFEANGHGTVIFGAALGKALEQVRAATKPASGALLAGGREGAT
jgi:phosphoacetylglucosamine mutase